MCLITGGHCLFLLAGELVAQFKFTVLLMNNGPLRITSGPFDLEALDSSHSLQDEELKVCAHACASIDEW